MPGLAGECSWPQYCPLLGFVLFVTAICFSLLMARNIFSSLFPSFWFYISIWNETLTPFKSHSLCTCINGRVHSLAANRPALNKSETFFLSSFAVDNNPALALHDQPRWQLMTEVQDLMETAQPFCIQGRLSETLLAPSRFFFAQIFLTNAYLLLGWVLPSYSVDIKTKATWVSQQPSWPENQERLVRKGSIMTSWSEAT